jgi:antirestriction protein ArdC
MKHKPLIKNNISRCYYSPIEDYISLPRISDFSKPEEYYSSLFHELIHWTGHGKRVNRQSLTEFDDENYSYEELVAEIGSCYLCALSGISPKVVENQTAYIQGWLKLGKENENIFPQAAKDAQRAVGYILSEDIAV